MSALFKLLAQTPGAELKSLSLSQIKERLTTYSPDPTGLHPDSQEALEAAMLESRTTHAAAQTWGRLDKATRERLAPLVSEDDLDTLQVNYSPPPDRDEE